MRSLVLRGGGFVMEEVPEPVPGPGELLVAPLFTGICGSDLHMRHQMGAAAVKAGDARHLPGFVLGHEFSAEVVAIGAGTRTGLAVGDRVASLPFTPGPPPLDLVNVGLSPNHPGSLAERMLVDADRSIRLPDAVPSDLGALAEPLAVGRHAVNLADRHHGPNVIMGCGPIGLSVLLALVDAGRGPVTVADLSPVRREIALALGADRAIDPAADPESAPWERIGFLPDAPSPLRPRDGAARAHGLNIFECTGVPAVFQQLLRQAPRHSHIVYAGVCMHDVAHQPVTAMLRELTVEYSFAYTPREFEQAIDMIVRRPDLVARLVTSRVPLADTEAAFDRLRGTPAEIKVLIDVRA